MPRHPALPQTCPGIPLLTVALSSAARGSGEKMSKSRGNVVNPDDIVSKYGADAMRLYEMFMGPLEAVKPWQTEQIAGVVRFQKRVYGLAGKVSAEAEMGEETNRLMHQTVKKCTADFDAMAFNTAISQLMIFSTHLAGRHWPAALVPQHQQRRGLAHAPCSMRVRAPRPAHLRPFTA